MSKYTVIAMLEAKPGKQSELESALQSVAAQSRAEAANVEYRLHKAVDNPQQFILYETWVSQAKHQAQFEKPYIIELVNELDQLLAKPYEAYFANEL